MSVKKKVFLSVIACAMVVTLALVSVRALQQITFSISNTVTFKATSVNCTVTAQAQVLDSSDIATSSLGSKAESGFEYLDEKFNTEFTYKDGTTQTKTAEFSDYILQKGEKLKYTISVKNNGDSPFNITVTETNNNYENMTLTYSYEKDGSPISVTGNTYNSLNRDEILSITIIVTITNTAYDATGNFNWDVALTAQS